MLIDGVEQVIRTAIVQEEDPLTESPKWRGAELVARGAALRHAVSEIAAHVVHEQVREEIYVCVAQARRECRRSGFHRRCGTQRTSDLCKYARAVRDRPSATLRCS